MSHNPNWSREEHILAFNLYNRIPFGRIDQKTPEVKELAELIGRSAGAVSFKLANFARLDPVHKARGVQGLSHGAKGEIAVWAEFTRHPEALALESERLRARLLNKTLEEVAEIETDDLPKEGVDRDAVVKVRVSQSFFRRRILSAYDFRCCVTGLTAEQLLTASHIVPWAEDKANRLNPRNGLCLNALHDRAFDRHLMWVEDDFLIRFSPRLYETKPGGEGPLKWITQYEGKPLILPKKFSPDPEFLKKHAAKSKTKLA